MKANELRIGNFYDHNGEYREVTPCTIEEVWNAEREWCKPIPLTEEWLLKFGFKKKYKSYDKGDFMFIQGGYDKLAYNLSIVKNTPRYVHQLQNLYFALTGEELTINQ